MGGLLAGATLVLALITFNLINTMLNSSAVVGVSIPALGTPERDTVRITLLDKFVSANLRDGSGELLFPSALFVVGEEEVTQCLDERLDLGHLDVGLHPCLIGRVHRLPRRPSRGIAPESSSPNR